MAKQRAIDAAGIGKLAVSAVSGLTDVVESMHGTIASVTLPIGSAPKTRTRGLTRLVYQAIRGVTGVVGSGVDLASKLIGDMPEPGAEDAEGPRRGAVVSALNGVIGDHLADTKNPLAMPMRLLRDDSVRPTGRVLVLVHGLCMNPTGWRRNEHDHGRVLAGTHGFTPVYASYNTGRHISQNGRDLARALEDLVSAWPVPITELVLLGHSMGGLVSRSACEYARRDGQRWLAQLTRLVFLGTPHHGAPLERIGNIAERVLGLSAYVAPIVGIGGGRSAGIKDLRFGNLLDEDWTDTHPHHRDDPRTPLPLPAGVACFTIAGTRGKLGDGLVPLASALGDHDDARHQLAFPAAHTRVIDACGHIDLLDHPLAAEQLAAWLQS